MSKRKGPLAGLKIVEIASIGPGPMCAMLLADLGATIIRIDRLGSSRRDVPRPTKYELILRGRQAIALDLKTPSAQALVLRLVEQADGLIEGFRPGVIERLGLGPDVLLARNPKIVIGRMTGWGQTGPLAQVAGHDLNFLAPTGALLMLGEEDRPPPPPLNLIGDFGGGALYLAMGLLAGILEARQSGKGQVVDTAIVDGVASLMTLFHGMEAAGMLSPKRGDNMLDGGAPFYGCYRCADGKWISIGPIEERFHELLLETLGIEGNALPPRRDRKSWPVWRKRFEAAFATRTRDEWTALFEGSDACVAPVLSLSEARQDPHARARGSFVEIDGIVQPIPAPRFSRTVPDLPTPPADADPNAALADWLAPAEIARLRKDGVLA